MIRTPRRRRSCSSSPATAARRASSPPRASPCRRRRGVPTAGRWSSWRTSFERDEHVYERADIFTVDLDGQLNRVTDDGFDHSAPIWAADGSIVAQREQSLNQILAAKQAFGSPVDLLPLSGRGGAPVNLTASWDYIPGTPRIAPEGRCPAVHGRSRRLDASLPRAAHRRRGRTSDARHPAPRRGVDFLGRAARRLRRRRLDPSRRSVRRVARWQRRAAAVVVQRRAAGVDPDAAGRAGAVHEQGRRAGRGLGDPARGGRRVQSRAADPGHPRRPAQRLRQRLLRPVPAVGGAGLCGLLCQPSRLDRIRREALVGHVGRLGRTGLRGRHGRRRPRGRPLSRRREAARRHRLLLRRLPHQLGDHADASASSPPSSAPASRTG